jgi:flagellar protein FliO/FliZ
MEGIMSHVTKYILSFICLVALVAVVGQAKAAEVSVNRQGDEVVIAAAVQSDFAGSEATVSAPDNSTIEISVAGADFSVDGKRQLFRFEDASVKTVSVSRDKGSGMLRFNVKGKNAPLLADQVRLTRADDHLLLAIPTSIDATAPALAGIKTVSISAGPSKNEVAAAPGVVPEAALKAATLTAGAGPSDEKSDMKAESSSEDKVAKGSENEALTLATAPAKDKRPESEIPVFTEKTEAKKAGGSSLERLVMTLFVVCALLGAALFGLKRWAARRGKNIASPTKIQILTQHHLGPKKSLAIIQVAGEAILIGITDQNISMLKTLALIDDEVPGHVPRNFADELDNDEGAAEAQRQLADEGYDGETENFAMKGLSDVRDMVSTRFGRSTGRDA